MAKRAGWRLRIRGGQPLVALVLAVAEVTMFGQPVGGQQTQAVGQESPPVGSPPAAGRRLSFDVASVRQNKSNEKSSSNVPLTEGTSYSANGGVFSARGESLLAYLLFAYKVKVTETHDHLLRSLPDWVITDHFDIQAKTELPNPTKDQMRLMMQSLLEDRFKLVAHRESRPMEVFALLLAKPGRTGAQLKPHTSSSPCPAEGGNSSVGGPATSAPISTLLGVWPVVCNEGDEIWSPRRVRDGGRDMSMEQIADWLTGAGESDLVIQDQTGLSGRYDFVIEFAPVLEPSATINGNAAAPDATAPPFKDALRDQLGLSLEKRKGSSVLFIVDHVERPSAN